MLICENVKKCNIIVKVTKTRIRTSDKNKNEESDKIKNIKS